MFLAGINLYVCFEAGIYFENRQRSFIENSACRSERFVAG